MKQRLKIIILTMMALLAGFGDAFSAQVNLPNITAQDIIKNPSVIALDSQGNLYVSEYIDDAVRIFTGSGSYLKTLWVERPLGLAIDASGNIYVYSATKKRVLVYNPDLTFSRTLGEAQGDVRSTAIAIDKDGLIYVLDNYRKKGSTATHDTIWVYNASGDLVRSIGSTGSGSGYLNIPLGFAVDDTRGEVYISDQPLVNGVRCGRIQVFSKTGTHQRVLPIAYDKTLTVAGQITTPSSLAVDKAGNLYVFDMARDKVLVFDMQTVDAQNQPNPVYLGAFISTYAEVASRTCLVIGKNNIAYVSSSDGIIEVYGLDGYVTMTVTPSSLAFSGTQFGPAPAAQSVTLSNTGAGTLTWTATKDQSWFAIGGQAATVNSVSGATGPGGSYTLSVSADFSGLTPGSSSGSIVFASDNGLTTTIPVTLTVLAPSQVGLSAGWLNFTVKKNSAATPQNVTVTVENATSLSWSAASDSSWLGVAPSSGTTTATASVSVNTTGLAVGSYTGYITLSAPGALGDNSKLTVNLTVQTNTKIAVATNLEEAVFTLTGPAAYSGSGLSWSLEDVVPGEYTIAYGAVKGYQKPASQTLTLGESGELAFSGTYQRDAENPALSLSTLADGSYTNNSTLNLTGTATDNLAIEEVLVNGAAAALNADGSFSLAMQLVPGPNVITTTAKDTAGNTAVDTRTIVFDQTAPVITVAGPADNSVTNLTAVTIEGTVDKTAAVSVQVEGESAVPAVMTGNFFSLSVALPYGQNTIQVTATDLAGNVGTAKRTVLFDNVNPTLAVTDPSQDLSTNQPGVTLAGTVDDLTAATVTVTLDGTVYAPAVTDGVFQQQLEFSEEKTYAVMVSAADAAGNITTVQRNIIYDKTPPALSIDPANTPTNQSVAALTGATEAGALVAVTSPTAVAGPVSYPTATTWRVELSGMTEGENIVSATAADQVGNVSAPVSVVLTLDSMPPDTVLTETAPALTNATSASIAFASTEPGSTFECSIDQMSYSACAVPALYANLNDGAHTFLVRAVDAAGNTDPEPASVSWMVDTVPPAASLVDAPASFTRYTEAQFGVTGDDVTAYRYRIDDGAYSAEVPVSDRIALSGLADGPHNVSVVGKDSAGNWQSAEGPTVAAWTVDTQAPSLELSALANGAYTNNGTMNIAGQAADNLAVGGVTVNGAAATLNADGSFSLAIQLVLGENVITTTLEDAAGNTAVDTRTIVFDQTAPVITVAGPADNSVTNLIAVTIEGTVDKTAAVSVQVQGESAVPAVMTGNAFSLSVALPYGRNTIQVTATDLAGNVGAVKRTVLFDNVNPTLAVTDPAQDLTTNQPGVTLAGTVDDLTSATVAVTLDGATFAPAVTNGAFQQPIEFTEEKTYAVYVTATDQVGNATTVQRNIEYLKTPTTLTYTGATLAAKGSSLTLSGVLTTNNGGTDLSGFPVSFTLGSGSDSQSCAGTTDAQGTASCVISPVSVALGSGTVTANFTGNTEYKPATVGKDLIVFSYPEKGAFVIGDKSAVLNKTATFWGSKWSSANTLSSGSAQASFKGFADSIGAATPACGGSWSAGTGASSTPPSGVPSYMAVVVSSAVTKSGSAIAGDIAQIVVIKTDPGYGPDPSQTGTGTVVGVFCQK